MSEQRYDLLFGGDRMTIEPHFCREWDAAGNGCYGTNPDHGYSFDEACDQVAEWHEQQAKLWRARTHHEAVYYQADAPTLKQLAGE